MRYDHLNIYKSALELAAYLETIVRGFEKYHKYTIGADLRTHAKMILFGVHRANTHKGEAVGALLERCEELKMLLQLAKELGAFGAFKQFEHSSALAVNVCRQAQGWSRSLAGASQ